MKKSVVALLVVVALVILISPGIVGRLAEKSVDEQLQWAADYNDDNREFVITSEKFDRGWFSSAGRHRVELGNTGAELREQLGFAPGWRPPAIIVDTELDHGLIPVTSLTHDEGSLTPGLGRARSTISLESTSGEITPLPGIIHSYVGLDGSLVSSYRLTAGSAHNVSWGPTRIEVGADALEGRLAVDGDLESIRFVKGDGETVTLGRTGFSSDMTLTDFGYAVGDLAFSIASMNVQSGEDVVNAGPMTFDARSSLDGERLDIEADMDFAVTGMKPVGDVSWSFDFVVNGWDAAAVGRLQRVMRRTRGGADPDALFAMAEPDLKDLFATGFEIRFDQLDVTLPQGTMVSSFAFEVLPTDRSSFAWTAVLLSLDAKADLSVPAALFEFAQAMNPRLNIAVAAGFLKKNGENYEMAAEYRKGLLTVNGAPMPIPLPGS